MIDYILLLERLYPNSKYSGSCADYSKISWKDNKPKPLESVLREQWVVLNIQLLIEEKIISLSQIAGQKISAGFWSSALGKKYFYDAKLEDQLNLIGVVAANQPSYFSCRISPSDIHKTYYLHDVNALNQVMTDGKLFKTTILQQFNELKESILKCKTPQEINAIDWPI